MQHTAGTPAPPSPAAPPTAPVTAAWRDGKILVMIRDSAIPQRCLRCGTEDGVTMVKRKVMWHSPLIYLVLLSVLITGLLGLIAYVIVARVAGHAVTVHVGVCPRHRRIRQVHILASWLGVLAGIGLIVLAAMLENGWLVLAGVLVFFAALIYAVLFIPLVTARRIDEGYVWLRRFGPAILDELPAWPGRMAPGRGM